MRTVVQIVTLLAAAVTAAGGRTLVDNTTSASGDAASLGFPHTIHSGSNTLLLVGIEVHAQTNVTSVSWGTGSNDCSAACDPGNCRCPLTRVDTVTDSGKTVTAQVWKLENAPAGTGTVTITLPSSHRLIGGATSFFGVDPDTPLGAAATNSGSGASAASVSVSGAAGGAVLDALGTSPNSMPTPTGAEQTEQYQASSGTQVTGAGSSAPAATQVSMSWSFASANWVMVAVPINPAPTPIGAPPCAGDCGQDGSVTVDEILTLVSIALGDVDVSACRAGDLNQDNQITVDEILAAVADALDGCPRD